MNKIPYPHLKLVVLIAGLTSLTLSACAVPSDMSAQSTQQPGLMTEVSATASASPTSTQTPLPLPTSTIERGPTQQTHVTPTISSTPDFPALENNTLRLADFVFDNQPPECELPCWRGLVIGQSGPAQVQEFFDTEFGFNGTVDFLSSNPMISAVNGLTYGLPDVYGTGYAWKTPGNEVSILTVIDTETNLLDGIVISWVADSWEHDLSPQIVLEEMGPPDWAYSAVAWSFIDHSAEVRLTLFYREGLAFDFSALAPRMTSGTNEVTELCLANTQIQRIGWIFITDPYVNGLDSLTPLQGQVEAFTVVGQQMTPIDQVFGVTEQGLYDLAIGQTNACLSAPVPEFP